MRLIDADKLHMHISDLMLSECLSINIAEMFHVIIDDAQTVDANPVVHCKDCKNWTEWENGTGSCQRSDSVMWLGTDEIDFCSFAERKDDEID